MLHLSSHVQKRNPKIVKTFYTFFKIKLSTEKFTIAKIPLFYIMKKIR